VSNDFINRVKRRVQLDKDNGWIFGVCAGISNFWGLDATFLRVGVVVTALFIPKVMIASYLIAWLVLDNRSVLNRG
jgi:phage shock protein C